MPTDHDSIVAALTALVDSCHFEERECDECGEQSPLFLYDENTYAGALAALRGVESLVAENARLRGLVNRIHPLAEGLAIRCEILESVRDRRLSLVTTEDLAKHAGDTSAAIYAALDRILADTNALKGDD